MTTIHADTLHPLPGPTDKYESAVAIAGAPIGLGRHIGIFVMGLASAFFASGTFALLTVGLFVPMANMIGLPVWMTIAIAVPLGALSITIAVVMFIKTVRVERELARNPGAI
jgi:hypothetical protein